MLVTTAQIFNSIPTEITCMLLHKSQFKTLDLQNLFQCQKQTKQYLEGHRFETDNVETKENNSCKCTDIYGQGTERRDLQHGKYPRSLCRQYRKII